MKSIIITKWVEPYKLLEYIKEFCQYSDYTFDGVTKNIEKKKFLKSLKNNTNTIGLYMKNVNKYYLFTNTNNTNILDKLIEEFKFSESDFEISEDIEERPFNLVDLGKAEASLILQ